MDYKRAINTTKTTYELIAKQYEAIRMDMKYVKEDIDKFISLLDGKRVLDVGCGPGRDLKYFLQKGLDPTGVDFADSFIKIAKKNAPQADIIKMDMRSLDFHEAAFDGVWACGSLLHIPKYEVNHVLKNIYKVLKSGGVLYVSVIEGGEEVMFEDKKNHPGYERFFARYSTDELVDIVETAGFAIVKKMRSGNEHVAFIKVLARK